MPLEVLIILLVFYHKSNYSNYMCALEVSITKIGNSKGIRLPARILRRYDMGKTLILEERPDEISLRPKKGKKGKLSWEETFQSMASEREDWSEWDGVVGDGLNDL